MLPLRPYQPDLDVGNIPHTEPDGARPTYYRPSLTSRSVPLLEAARNPLPPLDVRPYSPSVYDDHNLSPLSGISVSTPNQNKGPLSMASLGKDEGLQIEVDRSLVTRNLSILGCVFGWAIGITSLVLGVYIVVVGAIEIPNWLLNRAAAIGPTTFEWLPPPRSDLPNPYVSDHRIFQVPKTVMILISLLFNIVLAYIFESLNFIHSTSLRWQLWEEGRLTFNSNPRLFTSTKKWGPNKWLANVLSSMALILGFGGLTLTTFPVQIIASLQIQNHHIISSPKFNGPHYAIDFNAWGLIGLGTGLILQCAISTWCLFQKTPVGTWNQNPLAIARACKFSSRIQHDQDINNLTKSSVHQGSSNIYCNSNNLRPHMPPRDSSEQNYNHSFITPQSSSTSSILICSRPQKRQPPPHGFVHNTRSILLVVWIVFALAVAWVIIISVLSYHNHSNSSKYILSQINALGFLNYWQFYSQIKIHYIQAHSYYNTRRGYIGLITQCFGLALPLLSLHYVEVLTQLWRDERIWRRAASDQGTRPDRLVFIESLQCWPCVVLFMLKFLIPWIYSFALVCQSIIYMTLIPLIVFTGLLLLLALLATWLVNQRPRGPLPPTYGNIKVLTKLVDDWTSNTIYWGDKGLLRKGIRIAGTSSTPLPKLLPRKMYTGLSLIAADPVWKSVDVVRGFHI